MSESWPPGPPGHWWTGSRADFVSRRLDFLTECSRTYGDVSSFRLGGRRIVLVNEPDLIEQVLVADAKDYIKHFGLRMYHRLFGAGVVLAEGAAWLAQRRLMQPAFLRKRITLSFPGHGSYDEADAAREMAEACNAAWHGVEVRPGDVADHFAVAVRHAEVPLLNTHGVAKFLLSRAVRDAGFKAILTGEGADEIFGGYAHFRKDVLAQLAPAHADDSLTRLWAANPAARHLLKPAAPGSRLAYVKGLLGHVPAYIEGYSNHVRLARTLLRDEFLNPHSGRHDWRDLLSQFDLPRQVLGRGPLDQAMYLWSRTMLPNYVLAVLGDRVEMAHSVEGRLPYLDHKLVEYVVRLPASSKVTDTLTEKYVLREAARPFITEAAYRRPKHPFMAPPASTAGPAVWQLVQDTLRSRALADTPFYGPAEVLRLLEYGSGADGRADGTTDGVLTAITSIVLLQQTLGLSA